MTPQTIATLRDLLAKATKGPWNERRTSGAPEIVSQTRRVALVLYEGGSEDEKPYDNSRLIVAAVNSLPSLLDQLEALETLAEAVLVLKSKLDENGEFSIGRADHEKMGIGDMMIMGSVLENISSALAAYDLVAKKAEEQ